MSNFRIGIVGNGYVAKFHVEALKYIGHHPTVLISSNTSKTAEIFAKKYSIKKIIKDKVFFQNNISNEIDGLVVACSTENTTKYIDWCQKNNIWLLAEKPISYNLNEISSFLQFNKCLVAFNRRFYPRSNDTSFINTILHNIESCSSSKINYQTISKFFTLYRVYNPI